MSKILFHINKHVYVSEIHSYKNNYKRIFDSMI